MRRLILFVALGGVVVFQAPATAGCVSSNGRHVDTNTVGLVKSGYVPANFWNAAQSAKNRWNGCNGTLGGSGLNFPSFYNGSGGMEGTIKIDHVGGVRHGGTCAEIVTQGSNATVTVWSEVDDLDGTIIQCADQQESIIDAITHEFGHYLGLGASDCDGWIMSPQIYNGSGAIVSNNSMRVGECQAADLFNESPMESAMEDCGEVGEECNQGGGSPILLDLATGSFRLTSLENGVLFDIDGDGTPQRVSWTEQGSLVGFLFLDRNGNESVDGGRELFGDATLLLTDGTLAKHGYEALAEFDSALLNGNENGWLDVEDGLYSLLSLWIDLNHDGVSDDAELMSLEEAGEVAISLDYIESRRIDRFGNEFRYTSNARIEFEGNNDNNRTVTTKTGDVFFIFEDDD